jgi:hypothetical protein
VKTLNEAYSSLSARRRYEVWFVRVGLADGAGAWWFRYLLMNPARRSCAGNPRGLPVQVWATWFPAGGKPQSFIQGFPVQALDLSPKAENPFHFRVGNIGIEEDSCRGALAVDGHTISWDLRYSSQFRVTLSNKGWIGFSRTPHSDALFSGQITLDGRSFQGNRLGFGLQGHNCGYRHRNFWTWAHVYFPRSEGPPSTLEALVYDMPLGLLFRKAVLWHEGKQHVFRKLQEIRSDHKNLQWDFRALTRARFELDAALDGRGPGMHRLSYMKTDCSGSFEVVNNSLARASVRIKQPDGRVTELETIDGGVVEMAGRRLHSDD